MSAPFTNHLNGEKSPYLLQHVHNPVDWYPWGEEAFALAQSQDKPIFLSIGYATCHWCHVMEHESFENPEIATLLNDTFVNIKVDREERPEVDSVYMEFAQALMSSAGGWPLNVVLTPELKPFFAVTYLPPKSRRGLIGLDQFIAHIKQLWQSDERPFIIEQSNRIVEIFERIARPIGTELPSEEIISAAAEQLFDLADPVNGGMKGEPKFPLGFQAQFLMAYGQRKSDSRALYYIELTLDKMARGGIYDHIGGGFSRYSVDERWTIPHFEKMLYDNAILARTYLQGWRLLKKEEYRLVCMGILDYILSEMTHPEGGFYSAQDADTEGHEGLFYTWTRKEIYDALPPQDAELFCEYYNVIEGGNFDGRSVLFATKSLEEFAEQRNISEVELEKRLRECRKILFDIREKRPKPFKDDKILSGWNGLMIDAMAQTGAAFGKKEYTDAAVKAAEFIYANLWKEGKLLRRYRDGEARFYAGLAEYAYLIKGVLTLFEAGLGTKWLEWAIQMTDVLEKDFKMENGAFYQTDGKEQLLIRKCEFYDGAEPSGNAVHSENLQRLYQITGNTKYQVQEEDNFKAVKKFLESYAPGACYHLIVLQRYLDQKAATLVIAGDNKELLQTLFSQFAPHAVIVWNDAALEKIIPEMKDKKSIDGQTTVYICRQNVCQPPLTNKEEILKALEVI